MRGTAWYATNISRNLKRKMWGTWHIIFPLSEKVEGTRPRVPHLIAPMTWSCQHFFTCYSVIFSSGLWLRTCKYNAVEVSDYFGPQVVEKIGIEACTLMGNNCVSSKKTALHPIQCMFSTCLSRFHFSCIVNVFTLSQSQMWFCVLKAFIIVCWYVTQATMKQSKISHDSIC